MINTIFRTLKAGDKIYIVKNGTDLIFHECNIVSITPESANVSDTMNGVFSPITIVAKDGTEDFKLSRINSMLDYIEINNKDEITIISSDKSKINEYIKKVYEEAKTQLSKVDTYKNKIKQGESIILNIAANPKDTNDVRFGKLEESVSGLSNSMTKILELLQPKEKTEDKI